MELFRVSHTAFNAERINGIQDHPPGDPSGADGGRGELIILFDHEKIRLVGHDAEVVRRWYRHAFHNLDPKKDEDGAELISPEEQVRKAVETLVHLIERLRPRDTTLRRAAHRATSLVDQYLTGVLRPTRADDFGRSLEEDHPEVSSTPE